MYGIPDDVDWKFFIGAQVEQICIGKWDVQVHMFKNVIISMQGDFDHLAGETALSASSDEIWAKARTLVSLLEAKVKSVETLPKELRLLFSNGEELRVYDNSDCYESFTVTYPGGATIVV